ncbi:hypothetical protein ACLOE0_08450 [Limosilactobacillus fermentum]|uniref:hypothetical protein n=1 Tax=Limosilactobacillus fermentum TaxID=1613 RepID=UPI003EB820BA
MMKSKAIWWTTGICAALGLATEGLEGFVVLGIFGFINAWAVVKCKAYMTPERRRKIKARRVAKKEARKGQKSLLTKIVESQVQAENRKASIQRTKLKEKMKCPRCGSKNIQPAGRHTEKFSGGKATAGTAVGAVVFGPAGAVVGGLASGFTGKQTKKSDWVCLDCGRSFTIK